MLFEIQHRTELSYSQRISESVMEVRLTPRSDAHQTLRRFNIVVGPDARVSNHVDWQGNTVHQFSIVAFHDRVVIQSSATVATHLQRVNLDNVVDPMRAPRTSHRLLDFLNFGGPVLRDPRVVALAERIKLHECARATDAVLRVTEAVRDALTYQKGVTNSLTTVAEALDHGELAGDGHIAVATGRSYADVPPNRGVYRGESEERIAVSVTITPVDTPAHGPFSAPFHIPSYADNPVAGMTASGYQLEQQQQQQQQDRNKAQVQQQRQQQQ